MPVVICERLLGAINRVNAVNGCLGSSKSKLDHVIDDFPHDIPTMVLIMLEAIIPSLNANSFWPLFLLLQFYEYIPSMVHRDTYAYY